MHEARRVWMVLAMVSGVVVGPSSAVAQYAMGPDDPCFDRSSPVAVRACEGLALARAGRWAEAEARLESTLELEDPVVETHRARIEAALVEVRTHLGSLEVRCVPDGVRLTVDGRPAGITPLERPLRLVPGDHLVRGTLDGHGGVDTIASVEAGELALAELSLEPHDTRPILERAGSPGEVQRIVGVTAITLGSLSLAIGLGTLVGGLEGMPTDREALLDVARGTLIAGAVFVVGGLVLALTAE